MVTTFVKNASEGTIIIEKAANPIISRANVSNQHKKIVDLNFRSRLQQPICPKCRKKIIGRATDMENFLSNVIVDVR